MAGRLQAEKPRSAYLVREGTVVPHDHLVLSPGDARAELGLGKVLIQDTYA